MKSWKHWPYWLRGGVIGGGVAFASVVLTGFCEYLVEVPGYTGLGFECIPFAIPSIPFWFIPNLTSLPITSYEITVIAIWFVFGSLVGALIGYVKIKKSQQ